jgi:TolB-like protein/DNA-binding SARP family transcriptional activator
MGQQLMSSLRLNILGRFDARLSSGEVLLLPTRKAEVLLTYLSMTPGQPHSRDRLMNLLWSNRGEDQARNSLRQTLSALKKALKVIDPLPLQVDRTTVSVLAGSIELDTFELENSNATTDAINLYRGVFLEGIIIRDPNGQEWLTSERDRYQRITVEALEKLVVSQREAGELVFAIETSERLVKLDPLQESAWRQLMLLYATRGERNHALKAYTRCTDILESELGIEPELQTTELQATIRDGSFDTALTDIQPAPIISAERTSGGAAKIPAPHSTGNPSIAVLPFQNMSGDPEQDYFADGMSEEIITALSRVPDLIVISRNSTFVYKGRAVDIRQVGHELAVGHVLEGSIRKMGDRLRITAQLIDTQSGDHLWAERFDRKLDDIFAIQDEITHSIVIELQVKLVTGEYARSLAKGTNSIEAWELVRRSAPLTEAHVRDDAMLAKQLLGKALELDDNYSAAWALLGWVYWEESVWEWSSEPEKSMQMAFEAAQKSVSLDEHHADGYTLLGHVFMERGDTARAISMCEKGAELAPGDAEAMALLANILIDSGRVKEGNLKIQKALRLCPFPPPWYSVLLGVGFHLDGDNEAAIPALEQAIEREPDSNLGRPWLASTLVEMDRLDEARVVSRATLDIDPTFSTKSWTKAFKANSHARLKDNLLAAGFPE